MDIIIIHRVVDSTPLKSLTDSVSHAELGKLPLGVLDPATKSDRVLSARSLGGHPQVCHSERRGKKTARKSALKSVCSRQSGESLVSVLACRNQMNLRSVIKVLIRHLSQGYSHILVKRQQKSNPDSACRLRYS